MYASVEDVKAKVPQLKINATSRPTEAEVALTIEQIESGLDAALVRIGYATPVVGQLSVKILRGMVVQAVIAEIIESQALGIRDPNELGAQRAKANYVEKLKALADPNDPFELPDAQKLDVQDKFGKVASSMANDPSYGEPRITRDQVF